MMEKWMFVDINCTFIFDLSQLFNILKMLYKFYQSSLRSISKYISPLNLIRK